MLPNSRVIKGDRTDVYDYREIPAVKPKSHQSRGTRVPSTAGEVDTTARDDRNLVARARRRAARILIGARRRRDRVFARAREAGRKAGYEEGLRESSELLGQIERWREEMLRDEKRRRADLEAALSDLVVSIVSDVLHREMKGDRETVFHLVSDSLRRFSSPEAITLALSRNDLKTFVERRVELEELLSPGTRLVLTTDESLSDGEFHVRSDEGIVVGTVEDIAASLRRAIADDERGDE